MTHLQDTDRSVHTGTTSLLITNSRPSDMMVDLEPWGEHYTIPSGASFQVTAHGPADGMLDVEYTEIGVTLWAWPGSVVSLTCDGVELGPGVAQQPDAPNLPVTTSAASDAEE